MNLWIRHQNKENLYNVNILILAGGRSEGYIINTLLDGYVYCLGRYCSKDTVLHVLDEITELLKKPKCDSPSIYEMPKDVEED